VVLAAAYGGYRLGLARADLDTTYVASLESLRQANAARISELQGELVEAGLGKEVDVQTAEELRETIKTLRDQIGQITEEVTFYKSLMAPSSLARGLQIAEFEIAPAQPANQFVFHLLLTQVESRRDWIQGEVELSVRGRDEQLLSFTEIAADDTYPLKFRFRYFQALTGVITLPEDFVPESVEITARRRGANADDLTRTFAWKAAAVAETDIRG